MKRKRSLRAPRDSHRYTLRDGNKISYFGITMDPKRREAEHQRSGKTGKMRVEGPAVSRESALRGSATRSPSIVPGTVGGR